MKRITSILLTLALMLGGSAMAQIQIPGGAIKPPVPPVKQRLKPKAKARPKKQVKYYDEDEKVWKVGEVIVDETD